MAILIVDDEAGTRQALRDILASLGYKTILEAKNGEEALSIASTEKGRLEMIISDWEMPVMDGLRLLEELSKDTSFAAIPFLLITSDVTSDTIEVWKKKYQRMNGHLIKPFQKKSLWNAMNLAYQHNLGARSGVIYFGDLGKLENLQFWMQKRTGIPRGPIIGLSSGAEALGLSKEKFAQVSAICFDLDSQSFDSKVSQSFMKEPRASHCYMVCLYDDPQAVLKSQELKNKCQFFGSNVEKVMTAVDSRLKSRLETDVLFQKIKLHIQQKQYDKAIGDLEKLLKLDSQNSEALGLLGDVLGQLGKPEKALVYLEGAVTMNPFAVKSRIKLLETFFRLGNDEKYKFLLQETLALFGQNVDVLMAIAQISNSEEFIDRILAIDPAHKGALAFREKNKP